MRPVLRVLRAVAALGGAAALVVPGFLGPAGAADKTVSVGADGANRFAPASVTISPGDEVTWQYAGGSGHTVTSTSRNWRKNDAVGPPAVLNLTTSYLFDKPGTYTYVCTTHESVGMRGTVVVKGTAPKPTRTPTRTPPPTTRPPTTSPPPPPPSTGSASPSSSSSPSPSAGTASPVLPSGSVPPPSPTTPPPLPSVAPPTDLEPRSLGSGGLTPQPASGRGKGLPVMLALLLIGGVGSAELRALLAVGPPD